MWYLEDGSVFNIGAVRSMRRRDLITLVGGAAA
jgi:hypothetical protein